MRRLLFSCVLLAFPTVSAAQQAPCPTPGTLVYPLDEVLQGAAILLELDFNQSTYPEFGSPEAIAQTRDTVLANLEGKSPAERDALILARLDWSTKGTLPLLGITSFGDAGLFETFLDTLDRTDMSDHAAALRAAQDAFPLWNTTARDRYSQWSNGRGNILNPALDKALRDQSDVFKKARPTLMEKAQQLLSDDASFQSYMDRREAATDDAKLNYMLWQLAACIPPPKGFDQTPDALAQVPQTVADFYLLHMLILEAMNGSFHQYIFNSTGALAPDMIDVLHRMDLPEHAQAAQTALKVFPAPYPRDTAQRRQIMQTFLKRQDQALYDATWIVDDRAFFEAVQARAKREGYWPR